MNPLKNLGGSYFPKKLPKEKIFYCPKCGSNDWTLIAFFTEKRKYVGSLITTWPTPYEIKIINEKKLGYKYMRKLNPNFSKPTSNFDIGLECGGTWRNPKKGNVADNCMYLTDCKDVSGPDEHKIATVRCVHN